MTTFTVMTWNVQNLFLAAHDEGPDTHAQYGAKLSSLTRRIDQVKPDVLALQEIGGFEAFCSLKAALSHHMPYSMMGFPDARGICVALLATSPLHSKSIVHFRPSPDGIDSMWSKVQEYGSASTPEIRADLNKLGRDAIKATLTIDGKDVTVMTAHFKSKLITYDRQPDADEGSRFEPNDEEERCRYAARALHLRTAGALAAREQLNRVLDDPDKPGGCGREKAVIFMGDLNDGVDAATTQIIQGPPGLEIDTPQFGRSDKGDGYRLWNLAPLLPDIAGEPAHTRNYKGRPELIDHIFASRALVNPERLPIADTTASPERLPSIDDNPSARRNKPGSDHAAIFATFSF